MRDDLDLDVVLVSNPRLSESFSVIRYTRYFLDAEGLGYGV